MASENVSNAEHTKPLEDKIADLNLQEKSVVVAEAALEYVDGAEEAAKISDEEVKKELDKCAEPASECLKDEEKELDVSAEPASESPKEEASREMNIAKEEAQKGSNEGAYVVPTVDHRSIAEPEGEERKVDVPSGVVHENADPAGKPQQQGKGLFQSVTGKISSSVKSVFSGLTGGKTSKDAEVKSKETSE